MIGWIFLLLWVVICVVLSQLILSLAAPWLRPKTAGQALNRFRQLKKERDHD